MIRPLLVVLALTLAACKEEVTQDVTPVELTVESTGFYCQMNLLEHPGPKGQAHLEGLPGVPLFFSQARDAIAYLRAPEQTHRILAIYVNDMGAPGATWDMPGDGNWIALEDAFFVWGSGREGGMGAPEAIPFASQAAAEEFAAAEGGEVLRLDDFTAEMVLAPDGLDAPADTGTDEEFENRLRALPRQTEG